MSKSKLGLSIVAVLALFLSALMVFPLAGEAAAAGPRVGEQEAHEAGEGARHLREGRGFLGISLTPLTPELRSHLGAPEDAGILVGQVEPDSPAAAAGVKVGDIVTGVDGETVDSSRQLQRLIRRGVKGDAVTLEVYRDGRLEQLTATLGERRESAYSLHLEHLRGEDWHEIGDEIRQALEHAQIGDHVREALAGVEWHQIREQVHEALEDVDVGEHVRESMEGVDWDEIHEHVREAMENEDVGEHVRKALQDVDWDEIRGQVHDALHGVEWGEISEEVQAAVAKAMEALKHLDVQVEAEDEDHREE